MIRLLPYVDGMLADFLRDDPELAGVTVETQLSERFLALLPYVFLEATGGSTPDGQLLSAVTVEVTCWARGSKRDAADLAEAVRVSLWQIHDEQRTNAHGSLAWMTTSSYPVEIRVAGQAPDVFRYYSSYEVGARPPRRNDKG